MRNEIIQDPVFRLLERGLDLSLARQSLLINNVANTETPGYQRQDLNFEACLKETEKKGDLQLTHPNHLAPGKGEGTITEGVEQYSVRQDGGGVDMEKEMTLILENALYYQTLTRMVSKKLGLLGTVVREVR